MSTGALIAPRLFTALITPNPVERTSGGRIVATVLIIDGVPMASVAPSPTRQRMNCGML